MSESTVKDVVAKPATEGGNVVEQKVVHQDDLNKAMTGVVKKDDLDSALATQAATLQAHMEGLMERQSGEIRSKQVAKEATKDAIEEEAQTRKERIIRRGKSAFKGFVPENRKEAGQFGFGFVAGVLASATTPVGPIVSAILSRGGGAV